MRHELKTWPEFFEAVERGDKTFEVRRDDRGFCVGDTLVLQRFQPGDGWRGGSYRDEHGDERTVEVVVTYKLPGGRLGIDASFCVLGFRRFDSQALAALESFQGWLYGHMPELPVITAGEHSIADEIDRRIAELRAQGGAS